MEETENLHIFPVTHLGDDTVTLFVNYDGGIGNDVAFYLSKAFPETEIKVCAFTECIPDYEGTILDGKYTDSGKMPKNMTA